MKKLLLTLLWITTLPGQGSIAATDMQDPVMRDALRYVHIERLSQRVMLAYWIGTGRSNLIAIQAQKGLVLIDTEMSPRIMQRIKVRLERELGRDDWVYIINTHGHMHHTGGNGLFPGATVVGHDNLPQDMQWLEREQTDAKEHNKSLARAARNLRNLQQALPGTAGNPEMARRIRGEIRFWQLFTQDMNEGYDIVKPSLTFADRRTLDLGDLSLELVFFGKGGHTISDILIYVPQEKLLVTGAIIYQRRRLPWIFKSADVQDIQRFIAVLDSFLAPDIQIDHLVPTHSPPLTKHDMIPVRDYYVKLLTNVQTAHQQGLSLEQVLMKLSQRTMFPYFYEPAPGEWEYNAHKNNIKHLWHTLNAQDQR